MFTNIEGEWDEVMAVVKQAVDVVAAVSPRVGLVLKADIRPGFDGQLTAKVERVERALGRLMAEPYPPARATARPATAPPHAAAAEPGGAGDRRDRRGAGRHRGGVGAAGGRSGPGLDVERVGRGRSTTCTSTAGCAPTTRRTTSTTTRRLPSGGRTTRPGSTAGCTTCRSATRTPSTRSSTARSGSPTPTTLSEDDVATLERLLPDEGILSPYPAQDAPVVDHGLGPPARAGARPTTRGWSCSSRSSATGTRRRSRWRRASVASTRRSPAGSTSDACVVRRHGRWPWDRPGRRGEAALRRRCRRGRRPDRAGPVVGRRGCGRPGRHGGGERGRRGRRRARRRTGRGDRAAGRLGEQRGGVPRRRPGRGPRRVLDLVQANLAPAVVGSAAAVRHLLDRDRRARSSTCRPTRRSARCAAPCRTRPRRPRSRG